MAKVVRSESGGVVSIKAKELVPGDVVEVSGECCTRWSTKAEAQVFACALPKRKYRFVQDVFNTEPPGTFLFCKTYKFFLKVAPL